MRGSSINMMLFITHSKFQCILNFRVCIFINVFFTRARERELVYDLMSNLVACSDVTQYPDMKNDEAEGICRNVEQMSFSAARQPVCQVSFRKSRRAHGIWHMERE
jgi:hypothetical protein